MKRIFEGLDRSQATLLPDCVDDYVEEVNPVRAVDAFVNMLDLVALGFPVEPEVTQRPSYHPAVMLKLYHCGYLNQVIKRTKAWLCQLTSCTHGSSVSAAGASDKPRAVQPGGSRVPV